MPFLLKNYLSFVPNGEDIWNQVQSSYMREKGVEYVNKRISAIFLLRVLQFQLLVPNGDMIESFVIM